MMSSLSCRLKVRMWPRWENCQKNARVIGKEVVFSSVERKFCHTVPACNQTFFFCTECTIPLFIDT